MTLDEKIGQLAQYTANLFVDSEEDLTGPMIQAGLTEENLHHVGTVIGGMNAKDICAIQKQHLEKDRNTLALGCSFDTELVTECSKMASREAAASGIHVTFTPMVDYVRDARWGRVMESCGEDQMLKTCVKHFTQV